jgi:hypothetical protein
VCAGRCSARFPGAINPGRSDSEPWSPTHSTFPVYVLWRVSLTQSSEDKIDEISSKLDQICSVINTSGISSNPVGGTSQVSHSSPFPRAAASSSSYTHVPSPSVVTDDEEASGAETEGELSLKAHAAYATEFVQKIVSSTYPPEVTPSLDALRKIVETRNQQSKKPAQQQPANLTVADTGEGLTMPPLETAMTCLNVLKGKPVIAASGNL